MLGWETVVDRSPLYFQFSGYRQHCCAVLDLSLLGIPFHSFPFGSTGRLDYFVGLCHLNYLDHRWICDLPVISPVCLLELTFTFNFIHLPFRASLGNCGGLVPLSFQFSGYRQHCAVLINL